MLAYLQASGIGTNYFVSSGNETDLSSLDFVEYLVEQDDVSAIVLYLESTTEGKRIRNVGRRALAMNKPIVVMKAGNSGTARRAAVSHTGRLTADYVLFQVAFREGGYIEVSELDELVNVLTMLAGNKLPRGKGVGILTTSGGWGVMMAERCEQHGLTLPPLDPATLDDIRKIAPGHTTLGNPVDVTPQGYGAEHAAFDGIARHMLADRNVDMIIVRSATGGDVNGWAQIVAGIAQACDKPVMVNWSPAPGRFAEAKKLLEAAGIACVSHAGPLAKAAAACADFAIKSEKLTKKPPLASAPALPLRLASAAGGMSEYASRQCLQDYGIPVTRELLLASREMDSADLSGLHFPVAVKIVSPDLPHKTEAGGVVLNLKSADEVRAAIRLVLERAHAHAPHARLEGVSVQQMAVGADVILGAINDPAFGPYVMLGLGGIFAEVMRDVTYRYAPLGEEDALEMLGELRAAHIFSGVRGEAPRDTTALARTVAALSRLIWDHQDRISEIEINPLFVGAVGEGVVAADGLVIVK